MPGRGKPFKKGQSGNPGGRPRVLADIKALAQKHTAQAVDTLVGIMTNPKAPPAARVAAANAVLDRGYGKPMQSIDAHVERELTNPCAIPCPETYEEWLKYVELTGRNSH